MKEKILAIVLAAISASCVTPDIPPAEGFNTSPTSSAIVGMWVYKSTLTAPLNDDGTYTNTILFSPSGTGISRQNVRGKDWVGYGNTLNDKNERFTWKYDGGGWWTAHFESREEIRKYRMTSGSGEDSTLYLVIESIGKYKRFERVD